MNKLNALAKDNPENYSHYLKRMTDSFKSSTKGLIPLFIKGEKILDVGCGSGVVMDAIREADGNLSPEGLDLNLEAVRICKKKGFMVYNMPLSVFTQCNKTNYDCIIFSSVLHEFSSYAEKDTFTLEPISNALNDAYHLLSPGGRLIIRDGIEADNGKIRLYTKSEETIEYLNKYINDAPMFSKEQKNTVIEKDKNKWLIYGDRSFLKEFIYTYTWGKGSYDREVNEKYGIMRINTWIDIIHKNFDISKIIISAEKYLQYLDDKFVITDALKELFEASTILIIAEKPN